MLVLNLHLCFCFFGRIPKGVPPYVHVEQSREDTAHEKHMPSEKLEPVSDFQVADHVLVQDMYSKTWSLCGANWEGGWSFIVLIDSISGRFMRNVHLDNGTALGLEMLEVFDVTEETQHSKRIGGSMSKCISKCEELCTVCLLHFVLCV